MQLDVVANAFQGFQRVDLGRRKRGDDTRIGEASQRADVIGIPLAVHALFLALLGRLEIEDTRADVLVLAVRRLAFAVEVPHRLGQQLGDVRVLGLQDVPHAVDAGHVGFTALLGAGDAQQPDDVGVVGVEELARVGAVDAHLVDLLAVLAQILDVAQDVAPPVLAHGVADVRAQSHVGDRAFVVPPLGHGEALVQDEAFAVEQFIAHGFQRRRHGRQGEIGRVDARER